MKKEIVQSHNEVVLHQNVAKLRGSLTRLQSRSMLSILKRANEQVLENPKVKEFKIDTEVFLADVQNKDTSGKVVSKISKHIEELMTKIFEWGTVEEINKAVFMQEIKVTKSEVSFKFSDYIREHIKPISNALIIKDFKLLQSFRSEYARQLYKHLMMWEKKQSCYLSVKDLKDFLGVPTTKSYERMDNLKRKIINVAVDEINEKCPYMDLQYTNRTKQRSRAIEGFNFGWFNKKEDKQKENKTATFEGMGIDDNLKKYIGKTVYFNGGDLKIISVSHKDKIYSMYAHELNDKDTVRMYEISKAQLDSAK